MEQRIWMIFLGLLTLVALWLSVDAFSKVYGYLRLNTYSPIVITDWSVKEVNSERYMLHAKYLLSVNNIEYAGESSLEKPYYRNAWAAEKDLPNYAKKSWKAWYDSKEPQYSSLQKSFPLKECLTAVFMISLLIYFSFLRLYVHNLQK